MSILLWDIYINLNSVAMAKIQWKLYKWFGTKRTIPCGRNKRDYYLCCSLWPSKENSTVINNESTHKVICKVCGSTHILSSQYIDPDNIHDDF